MKGSTHLIVGGLTYTNFIMMTNNKFDIMDVPIILAFSILPDIDTENSKISDILSKLPLNIINTSLFLLTIFLWGYLYFFKKIIPIYYIIFLPIMVLFLKISSKNKTLKKISLSLFFLTIYFILKKYSILGKTVNIFLFFSIIPYFKHRSLTHSLLGIFIICISLYPMYLIKGTQKYYIVAILSYISHLLLADIFTKNGIPLFYPINKNSFSLNVINNKSLYKHLDTIFIVLFSLFTFFLFYILNNNK